MCPGQKSCPFKKCSFRVIPSLIARISFILVTLTNHHHHHRYNLPTLRLFASSSSSIELNTSAA
ncbi:hypothetical protein E2C01_023398 [Portunus trituberculatus]|uniref:Uncharacterized protein n=1 Tax=Portunus trituberculatus TaxID=210409 RepID=A0A5B7E9P5_PORTR|nr:hypothetical protein [Portunus trituberculatus]